MSIPLKQHRHL